MKVWTAILAGVLLAALPSLGNGALEDAGVFVSKNYTKFERRVLPVMTIMTCYLNYGTYEWFRINMFEQFLQDFENGNNQQKTTLRLGTPAMMFGMKTDAEFTTAAYCKYLPKAYHNITTLANGKVMQIPINNQQKIEYFAVRINNMERATIKKGWNYLRNVVKNRFPNNNTSNSKKWLVEKTAAGVIYVGVAQDI